jgi:hypothetical protein
MAFKKIGVLWKNKNKQDVEYLTGKIDLGVLGSFTVAIFQNKKKSDDQPDCNMCLMTNEE